MTVFSPHSYDNSHPGHRSDLEIPGHSIQFSRFAPLKETQVGGEIAGPLASLCITQLFDCSFLPPGESVEAVYRFPLLGDALIKEVTVRFGETVVKTSLAERKTAESQYRKAKKSGQLAALLTQEAEDVFTLHLSGITSTEGVQVESEFLLWLSPAEGGFSLRIPLTTTPRFSREDEKGSRPFEGQAFDIQWDPGHRARLSLRCMGFRSVECPSNALMVVGEDEGSLFISFEEGSVFPDQDILLTFFSESKNTSLPGLQVFSGSDGTFLALATPLEVLTEEVLPREIILLVDHSGSMEGAKLEAADWAVESFLSQLGEGDSFNLGFFHSACRWMSARPVQALKEALSFAEDFIENSKDSGGTELGMALEQALRQRGAEGSFSRHILVITDGQATDFARINTYLEREGKSRTGLRVSVVSIDSAPNEPLTRMMAEKGRGSCSFLSSNPDEVDITTSLDEIFKDFSRPFATGVSLTSSCPLRDAEGIRTAAKGTLDLGELISGRARWICGRCEGRPDGFNLLDGKGDVLAAALPGETSP